MLPIPDTATEVVETVSGVDALREAAERSLMDAADPKPAAEKVTPAAPSGGGDPEGATAEKAKPAEKPAAAPVAPEELKHVPEQFREFFKNVPKEAAEWVKTQVDGFMKDKDYRQKTTAAAELKREAERMAADNRVKLDFAETVIGDDEAMQAIRDLQARRAGKATAAPAKSKFSWSTASEEEIEAHLAERETRLRQTAKEEALREIRGERQQETQQQIDFREMATAAKSEFVDSGEYSAEEVDAVYDRLSKRGVEFTKDNVVETLRDFLPKREAKRVEPAAVETVKETRSTASVLSRATGGSPPVTAPAFVREKRAPRPEEEVEEAQWIVAQRRARAASRTS